MKKFFTCLVVVGVVLFLLIQLVPYGHDHTNPPVISEPKWDSQQTRDFAKRACFDCHSNESSYPWYAYVAPSSWLIQNDVNEGRAAFNFSDWQNHPITVDEIANELMEGGMPPSFYLPLHPKARLSDAEIQQFIEGLQKSLSPVP